MSMAAGEEQGAAAMYIGDVQFYASAGLLMHDSFPNLGMRAWWK
jgi:hypothetical protein